MKERICHITTVHTANDIRIYIKECHSLSKSGYEVFLIAPDSFIPTKNSCIQIEFIPKENNRILRLIRGQWHAFKNTCKIKADLYHFHDPELIPLGLILKTMGKKVIYDVHEDLPRQILTKNWLPLWSRKIIATIAEFVEWIGTKFFDGVITVTPLIQKRFPPHKTILIQNFPLKKELLAAEKIPYNERPLAIAYVGGLSQIRGALEIVKALEYTKSNIKLVIAGNIEPISLLEEMKNLAGWEKVVYLGFINRKEVARVLGKVRGGLVLPLPAPNHLKAQPNKLFEYMSAGIPVIASNFPMWEEFLEKEKCGITADPQSPMKIAKAIDWLINHSEEACHMGENAKRAIQNQYNWEIEQQKLVNFYKTLFDER